MKQLLIVLTLFCSLQGLGQTKAYYRLNGNSTDASGNSNNGTDTGITYSQANGKLNQGANFSGSGYISLGSKIPGATAMTISLWIKSTGNPSYLFVLDQADANSTWSGIGILQVGSGFSAFHEKGVSPDNWNKSFGTGLNNGKWHNLVVTWDATTNQDGVKLYTDGKLVNTATAVATPQTPTYNTRIGGSAYNATLKFVGSLDELIILDSVMSHAQVKNEYSRAKGFFQN